MHLDTGFQLLILDMLLCMFGFQNFQESCFLVGLQGQTQRQTKWLFFYSSIRKVHLLLFVFVSQAPLTLCKKCSFSVSKHFFQSALGFPPQQKRTCMVSIRLSGTCEGSPLNAFYMHSMPVSVTVSSSASAVWAYYQTPLPLLFSIQSHCLLFYSFCMFAVACCWVCCTVAVGELNQRKQSKVTLLGNLPAY